MSDNDSDLDSTPEERPAPHRVIGTPPPARGLLTEPGPGDGGEDEAPPQRELPTDPPDPVSARNWERVAAALFLISLLASVGFVAAYVGLEVHNGGDVVDAALRSNLALGSAMSLAFLAIGVGMVIWVRNIMPPVELTEERHPMASAAGGPGGVRGDVHRRRGGQPDHQAPAAAADADRGDRAGRARPAGDPA